MYECNRANHGIGNTEANEARIGSNTNEGCSSDVKDFGDHCNGPTGYSLNLWMK